MVGVWRPSRPLDSDKIRISAGLMRDNWAAIEEGSVPYDKIKLQKNPVPTVDATCGHLFTFNGEANSEVWFQDNNSRLIKMTHLGKLGSPATNIQGASVLAGNVTFDGTYLYTASLMVTARASVSEAGAASQSVNIVAARTAVGVYRIRLPAGVLTVDSYQVLITPFYTSGGNTVIANLALPKPVVNPAANTDIIVEILKRDDGSHKDTAFEVVVIGGR